MVFWQDARFPKRDRPWHDGAWRIWTGRILALLLALPWRWPCLAPGCSCAPAWPSWTASAARPCWRHGDGRARCHGVPTISGANRARPGLCHRLRAWPGALLPDGPAAPQRRRRTGRAVRAARPCRSTARTACTASAPAPPTSLASAWRRRTRLRRALRGRRQRRPGTRCSARPFEYALTGAAPRPLDGGRLAAGGVGDVFRPAGQPGAARAGARLAGAPPRPAQRAFLLPEASRWDAPLDAAEVASAAPRAPAARLLVGPQGCRAAAPAGRRGLLSIRSAATTMRWPAAAAPAARQSSPTTCTSACSCRTSGTGWRCASGRQGPAAPRGRRQPAGRAAAGHRRQQRPRRLGLHQQLCRLRSTWCAGADDAHPGQLRTARPAGRRRSEHVETILVKGQPAEQPGRARNQPGTVREAGGKNCTRCTGSRTPDALNLHHLQAGDLDHAG
jgi:hypothetical protein